LLDPGREWGLRCGGLGRTTARIEKQKCHGGRKEEKMVAGHSETLPRNARHVERIVGLAFCYFFFFFTRASI
jgi:hypothetical protein